MQKLKKDIDKTPKKITTSLFKFFVSAFLTLLGFFFFLSFLTYDPFDPSPLSVTGLEENPSNVFGIFGSYTSAILFALFGNASWLLVFFSIGFCRIYIIADKLESINIKLKLFSSLISIILCSFALSLLGFSGGILATSTNAYLSSFLNDIHNKLSHMAGIIIFTISIILSLWSIGITLKTQAISIFFIIKSPFFFIRKIMSITIIFLNKTMSIISYLYVFIKKNRKETHIEGAQIKQKKIIKKSNKRKNSSLKQHELYFGGKYYLPKLSLLTEEKNKLSSNNSAFLKKTSVLLENVLDDFGINGKILEAEEGPVVTRFELEPAPGTRSSRIVSLSEDIARSMSALSARIAIISGRNVIGIELPNETRETVRLFDVIGSDTFDMNGSLILALGKDISGKPVCVDLSTMPHLLVAGTTGSGKSVALNAMILSILYKLTPEECRLIMVDPKMLELSAYEDIPHLLHPVVTDPRKAVFALKWAVREMNDRYRQMALIGVRNISSYNKKIKEAKIAGKPFVKKVQTGFDQATGKPSYQEIEIGNKPIPLIVVIVDEMADLMLTAGREIEVSIQALAQKARAAGIHLIVATQRPSVDVITGTIKANLPVRISFKVTSRIDSRTVLGEQGAEQLLGYGDMLYLQTGGQMIRIHGPLVEDDEVNRVVSFIKKQGEPDYLHHITEETEEDLDNNEGETKQRDLLFDKAVDIVAKEGKVSTSFLQRHLAIGYNRAARIVDQMESEGMIGPANHVGKREVLIPRN